MRSAQFGMVFKRRATSLAVKAGIFLMVFLPAGAALLAAPVQFVYGGPSPRFRRFRADALFLVTGFDVFRLTLLFISVAGFIALRHW
jgi:hypothetical protein